MSTEHDTFDLQWIDTVCGPYALVTQHNGVLLPEALTILCGNVQKSGADCCYADAAIETAHGRQAVYKPDFSPDTLLSYNYVGSPLLISEKLWKQVYKSADMSLPAEDRQYVLTVYALLFAAHTEHIPQILFCGAVPSLPRNAAAVTAGMQALGRQGAAGKGILPGSFAVRYSLRTKGSVSIVIRTNGDADALRRTLESFADCESRLDFEYLIAAGDLLSEREELYCNLLQKHRAARLCYAKGETNDARIKNLAVEKARGAFLLFVEAGVEPEHADAVERLVAHAAQKGVGAAGGVLRMENGMRVSSELWIDAEDRPMPRKMDAEPLLFGELVSTHCVRNVTLLGSGAFLLRTDVFMGNSGFDETFDSCYCEAALSFCLTQRGMYNVCTPYAKFSYRGARRTVLSRRNRERCTDLFRILRVYGDPKRSQNRIYVREHSAEYNDRRV